MAEQSDREKENLKDYEGGYGGGRQRIEQRHEHAFGEGGSSTRGEQERSGAGGPDTPLPRGVHETHGPNWQEKFANENSAKYGQSGGKPIEQRGGPQSSGGFPEEERPGDVRDLSSRGGHGIRETEVAKGRWRGGQALASQL